MRRKPSPNSRRRPGYRCAEPQREPSIRECFGDSSKPDVDGRDLTFQGFDLEPDGWIEHTYRRSTAGTLNDRKLVALAHRREACEFKTVPAAFNACRDCHFFHPVLRRRRQPHASIASLMRLRVSGRLRSRLPVALAIALAIDAAAG